MDNKPMRCDCGGSARELELGCPPPEPIMALTMAYVPFQECDSEQYCAEKALMRGTLYKNLDKPFHGNWRCCR